MTKYVGILTAAADSPGLNAAIRGIGKAAHGAYGMQVIGFRDGFRGLMENRTMRLDSSTRSGILTAGGTILGTSRDKPHRMPVGSKKLDMTEMILANYQRHHLDALVCLGGGGIVASDDNATVPGGREQQHPITAKWPTPAAPLRKPATLRPRSTCCGRRRLTPRRLSCS